MNGLSVRWGMGESGVLLKALFIYFYFHSHKMRTSVNAWRSHHTTSRVTGLGSHRLGGG